MIKYFLFQIIEPLAEGAFGQVYKVIKKDSEEIFALKILSKSQVIIDKFKKLIHEI